MTGLLGEAPAWPPEEEPPPRGRRSTAGEARGREPEEKGSRGASDGAAVERPADSGAEEQCPPSAGIMTLGGFTAPEPRPPPAPHHWLRCREAGEGPGAGLG